MQALWWGFAVCVGMAMAVQAAVNSQLAAALQGGAMLAALVSFAIGTLALLVAVVASGGVGSLGATLAALPSVPAWQLIGGLLGAGFVFGTVFLAPRIGLLSMVVLLIAGQMVCSMAIDHFGLFQMPLREVAPVRLAGAIIVVIGAVLTVSGERLLSYFSH